MSGPSAWMQVMTFTDLVGMLGVAFIVGTYFALQIGRLSADSLIYSALNALGAGLILISLLHTFNLASFMIEVFWLAISLIGLGRWAWRRWRGRAEI